MRAEVPILAGVPETTAGDIEAAHFRGDCRADKNQNQRGQDQQTTAVKKSEDEREAAKDFQPRQINCEPHTNEPRQGFVILDVIRELNRVEDLNYAGVNKNATDDEVDNTPEEFHTTLTCRFASSSPCQGGD